MPILIPGRLQHEKQIDEMVALVRKNLASFKRNIDGRSFDA
ncbi:MAG: hypothetical protein R2762_15530 [Bryobacteraceae bacterium]